MRNQFPLLTILSLLLGLTSVGAPIPHPQSATPTPALAYNAERGEIDARIDGWTLRQLLDRMVKVTGWRIYVEPGTQRHVSSSFRSLETREALRRLLGDLSFVLVAPTNAPAQLFIYTSSLQQATQLIPGNSTPNPGDHHPALLPNELIVRLKPGAGETIDDLARRLGAKIVGRSDDLQAYRLTFEDGDAANEARRALQADPDIAAVDDNYRIHRPPGIEAMAAPGAPVFNLTPTSRPDGSHLVVGLIDTAVQTQGTGLKNFLLDPISLAGEVTPPATEPTHGTSMAETILRGLAASDPDGSVAVRLLPVDIYGPNASTTSFDVAMGVYTAIKNGATVVNLSMGSGGDSGFLRELIAQGDQQGVLFIAAAGNQPTTEPTYPAAYPQVIAVTAGDRQGNIAPYANFGDFVDIIAPGGGVVQFAGQSYFGVGTSFSTALVSGTAASLAASGNTPVPQLRQRLLQTLGKKTTP